IDAARAERLGLVTEVVEHDRLLDRALELAGQIAEVPADTMAGLKEIYARGIGPVIAPALAAEQDIAAAQPRDFGGLGERFMAVSQRNRQQLGEPMNSKILTAPVVLATAAGLALATAAPAPARPGVADFGATQHLHDGGVTIAYTLEELEPSDDVVSNVALQGRLWEVSVTVEAVEGAATPVIPFFNARS